MMPVTLTELIESDDRSKWLTAAELIESDQVPLARADELCRKYPKFADFLDQRQKAREVPAKNH